MIKKRFEHIDFLRAVAIVGVVAIHTLSFHLNDHLFYFFWNYLNFVVVSFVFCSGYVLTARYREKFRSEVNILSWYSKRLLKLIIPFYLYLIAHYLLWLLFPQFFSGLGLQKSIPFILKSIFLVGGIDLNWLTLLFIQLTVLFPILMNGLHKKRILYAYIAFSLIITIIFTIIRFPYNYFRNVMWISWSVILLISMFIFSKEHTDTNNKMSIKRYIYGALGSGTFFALLMIIHSVTKQSFQLVDYKYPPGFYYISYGLCVSFLILIVGELTIHKSEKIKKISLFLSKHSYTLFFVHYIVLDVVLKMTKGIVFWSHPFIQFMIILSVSLAVCEGIAQLESADYLNILRLTKRK